MLIKNKRRFAAVVTTSLITAITPSAAASAAEEDTRVEEYVSQFEEEAAAARASLVDHAALEGVTPGALAERALEELQQAEASSLRLQTAAPVLAVRPIDPSVDTEELLQTESITTLTGAAYRDSDSDDEQRVAMDPAGGRGDLFYYPSKSAGINHGHIGMFRWKTVVVEAANKSLGVRKINVAKRSVPENKTLYMWVSLDKSAIGQTDAVAQRKASNWANQKDGAEYRPWTDTKNKYYSAPFNCSQLVWAAYDNQGYDLDNNGGDCVWPANIVDSQFTHNYKII